MIHRFGFRPIALLLLILAAQPLGAQVPQILNYQGKVHVGGTAFNGAGKFRFALVNGDGTTSFWSNDGTSVAGSQPTAAVSLPVVNGLYVVPLGDTSIPNMTAIPASVFENNDVRVRVWFDDNTNGSELLAPDQRITSVGYAMMAQTVPDGAVTSPKLAPDIAISGHISAASLSGDGSQLSNLNAGSVFTRWGNSTAPQGTTLLYSGIAFGAYYGHSGSGGPIVLAAGDPGPSFTGTGAIAYPIVTAQAQTGGVPPGLAANKVLKAAVCYSPTPTTVIWGTWNPPAGWSVVYKGYALASNYTHASASSMICVDADAFDDSQPSTDVGSSTGLLYPLTTQTATPQLQATYPTGRYVKAAVIARTPPPSP